MLPIRRLAKNGPMTSSPPPRSAGPSVLAAQSVPLPPGYRMEWTGEYGALVEAKKRLAFIVPLSLLLIMMLPYGLLNSIRDGVIALAGIPFAVSEKAPAVAKAGLWVQACQRRPRHARLAALPRAQEYSAHGQVHRNGTGPLQRLLEGLTMGNSG